MSRRWVSLFLVVGLLAACSGSNAVVPFEQPDAARGGRDAGPSTDATMAADDATGDAEAGPGTRDDGPIAPPPDASPDATVAEAGPDAGPPDAGPDAGPPDAAPCVMASVAGNVYVDGARGVDDAAHGGGPAGCAYRTITYAIAHTMRSVLVGAGTYSAATGETLPFVLTGRQGIACTSAMLVGQGQYQSGYATVVFTGATNLLSGCTVVGDDMPGACVLVSSDGTNKGHDIESADLGHCGDAGVRIDGTLLTVNLSNIHDCAKGISWSSVTQGVMSNDTFSNNVTRDIACDPGDTDAEVTGSNDRDGAGNATCSECLHCPFN